MAIKAVIHAKKGGQGKTTITANLSLRLAGRGKRVLVVDGCAGTGLQDYFNVEAEYGIPELLSGTPLEDLIGEVVPNLFFLPAADLPAAEAILERDRTAPYLMLEDRLGPYENQFDFILFDTSPNEDTRLIFSILYYVDHIITPCETKEAGWNKLLEFEALLEGINPRIRLREGKSALKINKLVPYWLKSTKARKEILSRMQERFGEVLTAPVGECDQLQACMAKCRSLADYVEQTKSPLPNEKRIAGIFEGLVDDLLANHA